MKTKLKEEKHTSVKIPQDLEEDLEDDYEFRESWKRYFDARNINTPTIKK